MGFGSSQRYTTWTPLMQYSGNSTVVIDMIMAGPVTINDLNEMCSIFFVAKFCFRLKSHKRFPIFTYVSEAFCNTNFLVLNFKAFCKTNFLITNVMFWQKVIFKRFFTRTNRFIFQVILQYPFLLYTYFFIKKSERLIQQQYQTKFQGIFQELL